MGNIQVIESETGGLQFERAFVLEVAGVPVARAVVGGVLCNIETRPGPLADGLAFLNRLLNNFFGGLLF